MGGPVDRRSFRDELLKSRGGRPCALSEDIAEILRAAAGRYALVPALAMAHAVDQGRGDGGGDLLFTVPMPKDGGIHADRDYWLNVIGEAAKLIEDEDEAGAAVLASKAIPEEFRSDRDFVQAALERDGTALLGARNCFKADRELVTLAVREKHSAFQYAAEELRGDRTIALIAVQGCGTMLEHTSEAWREDREMVMAAVRNTGQALEFAAERFRDDRDLVLEAVLSHAGAFQYASERLRGDRDLALTALRGRGDRHAVLQNASVELRSDREFVAKAVYASAGDFACWLSTFKYAAADLQADRDFVLRMVGQDGKSLSAALRYQNDRDIVMAAVRNTGRALMHASNALCNDPLIVLAAIRSSGGENVFQDIGKSLQTDRAFVLRVLSEDSNVGNSNSSCEHLWVESWHRFDAEDGMSGSPRDWRTFADGHTEYQTYAKAPGIREEAIAMRMLPRIIPLFACDLLPRIRSFLMWNDDASATVELS